MGTLARPHIAIHREMDGQECPSYERIRVFKQSRVDLSVIHESGSVDASGGRTAHCRSDRWRVEHSTDETFLNRDPGHAVYNA